MPIQANSFLQKISAYAVHNDRISFKGLRLDFNERTVPVSQRVAGALEKWRKKGALHIYPDDSLCRTAVAKYANVEADETLLTNGSDRAIELIFKAYVEKGDKVVIPSPSFSMFYQAAAVSQAQEIRPMYKKNGEFPYNEVEQLLEKDVKLIIICNPNNPTGSLVGLLKLRKILEKARERGTLVYVDEAYYEFSRVTAAGLIKEFPNLIITRTFSKAFGLPSLRIGYIISCAENIREIEKIRGPFDVNMAACVAAQASLEDKSGVERYTKEVMKKAKPLTEKFLVKKGKVFLPSEANFILFKTTRAPQLAAEFKRRGILVKSLNIEPYGECIRVTIGTVKQMKEFIKKFPL